MLFKSQVEADMHAVLFKQVDELKEVCALVRDSTQLQALMIWLLALLHNCITRLPCSAANAANSKKTKTSKSARRGRR